MRKNWIPLKLYDQITQHVCKNTEEKVKGKTFFSHKAYLATFCKSDLPSACHYSSSGSISKKTKTSCSLSLPFPWEQTRRGCARSYTHLHKQYTSLLPIILHKPGGLPHTKPSSQCKWLAGPTCEKCHKGEKDQDSWDVQPAVVICTLPLLNKEHTFPVARAGVVHQNCSSKPAGAAEERWRSKQQKVDRQNNKQINARLHQSATVIFVELQRESQFDNGVFKRHPLALWFFFCCWLVLSQVSHQRRLTPLLTPLYCHRWHKHCINSIECTCNIFHCFMEVNGPQNKCQWLLSYACLYKATALNYSQKFILRDHKLKVDFFLVPWL